MCYLQSKHIIFGLLIYFGVTFWGELLEGGEGQEGLAVPQTLTSTVSFKRFQGPYVRLYLHISCCPTQVFCKYPSDQMNKTWRKVLQCFT